MEGALKILTGVVVAIGAWVFADLYLRVDLPGVAALMHLGFRTAAAGVAWMQEGDGNRPALVAGAAGGVVVLGVVLAALGKGRPFWRAAALPIVVIQGGVIVIGALMERGAALLLVPVGIAVAWKLKGGIPSKARFAAGVAVAAVTTALGALYLVELLAARSEGYAVTAWLAARAGDGGLPGWGSGLWLLALAAVLVAYWELTIAARPDEWWEPAWWPVRLGPLVLVGFGLIGHAYVERVFDCSGVADYGFDEAHELVWPEGAAAVRVIPPRGAEPAFRVALNADGSKAALSLRGERAIGYVGFDEHGLRDGYGDADPGALPAYEPNMRDFEGQSLASTEELLWADGAGRFYGTALGGHPDFYGVPNSPSNVVNNVILELPADASRVTRSHGVEHLCWIGAIAWREADGRLYLGCEYEPALHRYDPEAGRVEATLEDEAIGDVAALAADPEGDSLYSVSFWSSQAVAEIDPATMEIRQRRDVGGAHYDVALDAQADRLFLSAYYGSRVRVLRASDLEPVGRIPTGLGTRALATDPSRDLVLASSAYDGVLTVARSSTGEVLARHRVGGHVKDIAIDAARGRALLGSQCGLVAVELPEADLSRKP